MFKKAQKKGKISNRSSRPMKNKSPIENSFLNETSFISEIDLDIREEIEKKFKKSSVNSKYIFPRKTPKPEPKRKKNPKSSSKSRLSTEKSLPAIHKLTSSAYESTNLLRSLKKTHRATSSIRSIRESRIKVNGGLEHTHSKNSSQERKRSKTPGLKESIDSTRHQRVASIKRGYYEGVPRPKSQVKNPAHLYTASMETVIPSAIIKSVAYYK